MAKERHLVAMGGGGFSMEDPVLDRYVLGLAGVRRPRVCFLPTASGDSETYCNNFMKAFARVARPSVCLLFKRGAVSPARQLAEQDVIYVGGGNTANLLALWSVHGVDEALAKCWSRGVVLAGISAGMNCWFEGCSTDSFGKLSALPEGMGLVRGFAACPHFDGEATRRPSLSRFVKSGLLPTTLAADDFAAFHFSAVGKSKEPKLVRCVKSRLSAGCYEVRREGGKVVVEALATEMLDTKGQLKRD
jgi:dipeptidase E